MIQSKLLIKPLDISKRFPITYGQFLSSRTPETDVWEDIWAWLHLQGIRLKVCHNLTEDLWYYDGWVYPKQGFPVRKQCLNFTSYEEAFNAGIVAVWEVLEFQAKKSKTTADWLTDISDDAVRRAKRKEYFKRQKRNR